MVVHVPLLNSYTFKGPASRSNVSLLERSVDPPNNAFERAFEGEQNGALINAQKSLITGTSGTFAGFAFAGPKWVSDQRTFDKSCHTSDVQMLAAAEIVYD